jgi:ATP synthase protein I
VPPPGSATAPGPDTRCAAAADQNSAESTPVRAPVRAMSPIPRPPAEPSAEDHAEQARATESTMWTIVGHMAASMAVYGGLGYLLGRWTGHPILLLFGVLFGVALSLWYTIHTVGRTQSK